MSKYFEENMLIEHLTKMLVTSAVNNTGYKTYASNVFRDIAVNRLSVWLEFAPTADVVEVVRCEDCRYWDNRFDVMVCNLTDGMKGASDYCSYGERREDDEIH